MTRPPKWRSAALFLVLATAGCRDHAASSRGPVAEGSKREATLAAARLWSVPKVPPGKVDFSRNTPGPGMLEPESDVDCDFILKPFHGTTPKFFCTLPDGSTIKVKYGATNPEVPAEEAASRLMAAFGFAADRMMLVHSGRCKGCPPLPALALDCLQKGAPAATCLQGTSATHVGIVNEAMIERPVDGKKSGAI